MPAPTPDYKSSVLNKIKAKEDIKVLAPLDAEQAREEAGRLEKSKRDALRREIEGYKTDLAPADIEDAESDILDSIVEEMETQDKLEQEQASLVVVTDSAADSKLSAMQKMTEGIMGPIKGIMKSLIAILPLSMIKSMVEKNPGGMLSRMAGDIIKEKSIYAKMSEIFGAENMEKTTDDGKYIKELTQKYNLLPKPVDGKKMTFEEYYTAKISQAKIKNTPPYNLAHVKNAEIDAETVQKKSEEVVEKKNDEERKRLEVQEQMENNPEVKKAVHLYALAKALSEVSGNNSPEVSGEDMKKDLAGRPEGGDYAYKSVATKIATWFNDYSSRVPLGVEINNYGTLEESDGNNWLYDNNLLTNFGDNLKSNPTAAFNDLANLNLAGFSMNATAANRLPQLQTKMREQLAEITGGSVDAPAETSEDA